MKKLSVFILFLALSLQAAGQNAKYVFVIIGDGMGLNTVELTEYYKASVSGKHGTQTLTFGNFPVCGYMTTFSANRQITDSAASATALASGKKTNQKYIGLDAEGNPLELITETLAAKGKKVALVTTDAVNYATPAGYSAHRPGRKMYDEIFSDMLENGFEFYAGSGINKSSKKSSGYDPFVEAGRAGYTVVGNPEEYKRAAKKAKKILYVTDQNHRIGRAIDRENSDKVELSVADYTNSAVDFLMKDGCSNGFFIMAEVGVVDVDCHGNDAAAAVLDVLEVEKVADVALKFYNEHPDETAIIVLSDHDTGGIGLLPSDFNPGLLRYQKGSIGQISKGLEKMLQDNKCPSWEEVRNYMSEKIGLWTHIQLKATDTDYLKDLYDRTIAKSVSGDVTDEFGYNHIATIISEAVRIANKYCGVVWSTHSHSAAYAPVYYLGPQPELFMGRLDNTDIPVKLLKVIGE